MRKRLSSSHGHAAGISDHRRARRTQRRRAVRLRYYEAQGLIHAERTVGGQRRYARGTLRRVAFVRSAQRVGLSLEEIAAALATLPANRTPTKADWARLSRGWRSRLDERIGELQRLRDQLTECIGCGCLSLRSCALHNPGDGRATEGPGARILAVGLDD